MVQTAAINTMRHLAVLIRLGPAIWASLIAMLGYTAHSVVQVLRRG